MVRQHKFIGIWTICVAISISAVAAYYSIVGLAAIFAAAVIPIIIMGSVLEVAKITTAVWLHTYWNDAAWLLRTYLTTATLILMLITSMGIFGFLSKAHIEQSANGLDVKAKIEQLDNNVSNQLKTIDRAKNRIIVLGQTPKTKSTDIESKIADQQSLIKQIRLRLAEDIAVQNNFINPQQDNIIKSELSRNIKLRTMLDNAIANNNVKAIQQIIGAKQDGVFGPATTKKLTAYKVKIATAILALTNKLTASASSDRVKQLRTNIQNLQLAAGNDVKLANNAINTLRKQLLVLTSTDNAMLISNQEQIIESARASVDAFAVDKFKLQAALRKLEVEVGPVKYIAELVYGSASSNLLEKSVRGVIVLLVIVFDPLAIVLILAGFSTISLPYSKSNNDVITTKDDINIVDNPSTASYNNVTSNAAPKLPPASGTATIFSRT